jgi:hypothetical protein
MFSVRLGWARIAVGVAGASCLAVTACGGVATSSPTAVPSASSTVDPLAGLSAAKVVAEAKADAENAATLTIQGTVTQQGQASTVDLAIRRGQGCMGTVGVGGQGTVKLIIIGQTIYMNPDKQFWTANSGASAAAVIALVNGRYIKLAASNKNAAGLGDVCNLNELLNTDTTKTYTKGAITTLDGKRVLTIKGSDGGTGYVTDTSKPEYVKVTAPKGSKDGYGQVTVVVDAPVKLTAPPASEVIDGTKIGL